MPSRFENNSIKNEKKREKTKQIEENSSFFLGNFWILSNVIQKRDNSTRVENKNERNNRKKRKNENKAKKEN